MAKRIRPSGKEEAKILRFLTLVSPGDPRNHAALPVSLLWDDRIVITPLYHSLGNIDLTPNMVLHLSKQYLEVWKADIWPMSDSRY